jgi:hypothetical protein
MLRFVGFKFVSFALFVVKLIGLLSLSRGCSLLVNKKSRFDEAAFSLERFVLDPLCLEGTKLFHECVDGWLQNCLYTGDRHDLFEHGL